MSEKNGVSRVKCIKEIPGRPMFAQNSTYEAHPVSRGDTGLTTWVGIPGTSGHDFDESTFNEHFKRV